MQVERDTLIDQSIDRPIYRRIAADCPMPSLVASVERLPDSGEAIPGSEFNRYGI